MNAFKKSILTAAGLIFIVGSLVAVGPTKDQWSMTSSRSFRPHLSADTRTTPRTVLILPYLKQENPHKQ